MHSSSLPQFDEFTPQHLDMICASNNFIRPEPLGAERKKKGGEVVAEEVGGQEDADLPAHLGGNEDFEEEKFSHSHLKSATIPQKEKNLCVLALPSISMLVIFLVLLPFAQINTMLEIDALALPMFACFCPTLLKEKIVGR